MEMSKPAKGQMGFDFEPLKAKQELFEELCSKAWLATGFKEVYRNKGAPGIDGISVQEFLKDLDKELDRLVDELINWRYKPQPVRRVEIPKPQGGVRVLGVPCVRDRVVQATMRMLLEPILDPQFSDNSYGFRPGRNQGQAIHAAQLIVESGKEVVVDIDLAKFFDRIHHDRLISRLSLSITDKRILRLIGQMLRSGVMKEGLYTATTEGSVQGGPLSPLLSNVVLDELDKELEKRGLEFCRFADDCNIFVKTLKAGERVMKTVTQFIESRLKLVVNQDKSQVAPTKEVKFLGTTIIKKMIAISLQSMKCAIDKVKELTPRGTHLSIEDTIKKINSWYVGWSNYYSITQYPSQLLAIEAHIRRRLRSRIIGQQKRRRHLFNTLRKRGLSQRQAAVAFKNKGRWALSHTPSLERAYPNDWFIQKGFKTRTMMQLSHWFNLKLWPRFT